MTDEQRSTANQARHMREVRDVEPGGLVDPGGLIDPTQPNQPTNGPESDPLPDDPRAERLVAAAFLLTIVAGLALLALYIAGGQTQFEGVLLCLCLGGIGFGLIVWAHRLLPNQLHVEMRHPFAPDQRAAA